MDEVLDADDAVLAEVLLDLLIGLNGDAGAVLLDEAALVDQLGDALLVRVPVGHPRLDQTEHLDGGFVELHESPVVQLSQTQQSEHLPRARVESVDALDPSDKGHLGFRWHVVRTRMFRLLPSPIPSTVRFRFSMAFSDCFPSL